MNIQKELELDITDFDDKVFFDFSDILNSKIKIATKYKIIRKTNTVNFIEVIFNDNTTKQMTIENHKSNNYDCFKNPDNELSIIWCNSNIRNDHAIISILISYFKKKLIKKYHENIESIINSLENFEFDGITMLYVDSPDYSFSWAIGRYNDIVNSNIDFYKKIFELTKLKRLIKDQNVKLDEINHEMVCSNCKCKFIFGENNCFMYNDVKLVSCPWCNWNNEIIIQENN